ncbi:MAG: hypothetical protein NTV80_08625 [Verrucomicrobia bacterium]|nr:hypothetical protein [Verrucomicrobiota bacterium]
MGAGIVIIVWSLILGISVLIWIALAGLAFFGWKQKKRWLKWCAGIPAALLLVLGIAVGGFIVYGTLRSMSPVAVFKDSLGVPPPASVSDIESDIYWFADTGSVYLRFKISESDFRKIVPSDLAQRTMQKMKEDVPTELGAESPKWWTYEYKNDWIYLLRDTSNSGSPGRKGFYSETEYFAYDPKTEIAYYRFLGID